LIVVANNGNPSSGDAAIIDRLETLGYTVTTLGSSAVTAADAEGKDVVLVSSSIAAWALGTKLRDVDESVIIWKPWAYDAMEMTANNGAKATVTTVVVVDAAHPLAAGFGGTVTILSSGQQVAVGTPGPGGTVVAEANGRPALFVFAPGDTLDNGQPADGCRIAYPAFTTTPTAYTADGWALFDNAVGYAAAGCPG
jgi:hypothetical protein